MNNSRIPEYPGAWEYTNLQGYLTCLNHLTLLMVHDMISGSYVRYWDYQVVFKGDDSGRYENIAR
jgi:hypothetical protein